MTDSYIRIRFCVCYFDYYIYVLNYRKNSGKYVNKLVGLSRLDDAHLMHNLFLIEKMYIIPALIVFKTSYDFISFPKRVLSTMF